MNKEKIIKLISQIEEVFSEIKSEILGSEKSDRKKSLKFPPTASKESFGTVSNKELLEKIKKVRINFESYPLVRDLAPALVKALHVLDVAKNEFRAEELTAAQISMIMPYLNKLKQESRHAITKTLDRHKNLVNIRPESPRRIFYSIKDKGIKYYKNYEPCKKKTSHKKLRRKVK